MKTVAYPCDFAYVFGAKFRSFQRFGQWFLKLVVLRRTNQANTRHAARSGDAAKSSQCAKCLGELELLEVEVLLGLEIPGDDAAIQTGGGEDSRRLAIRGLAHLQRTAHKRTIDRIKTRNRS
mgnify:CR=1 FL=1